MKVYVAIVGIDYEGECADSIQLFTTLEAAEQYGKDVVERDNYDYYLVEEREFVTE